jgi:hypothetical protein
VHVAQPRHFGLIAARIAAAAARPPRERARRAQHRDVTGEPEQRVQRLPHRH